MQNGRWKTVDYSRNQIVLAGKTIHSNDNMPLSKEQALLIIDNWRAAHAYPLQIIYNHLRRMTENHPDIVVAQRLKRLDSIVKKLEREPNMNLWVMQDLGGCRVIVPDLETVDWVINRLKSSRIRHIHKKDYDYIRYPKVSGYRCYHMVYQFQSDRQNLYNRNMLIEIQVRTRLQHLWATAVETMGIFTRQALKASQGQEDVLRFFSLVSSLFAIKENSPLVPNTSSSASELVREINAIDEKQHVIEKLRAIRSAVIHDNKVPSKNGGYYLLIFDYVKHSLAVAFFDTKDIEQATTAYNKLENNNLNSQYDVVLVSVSSFDALKNAYPNYFSDISEFIGILNVILKT